MVELREQLKKIVEKVDLTATQRQRAIDLYTHLCEAIENKVSFDINFYAQGSFATKTAVRPYKNGNDHLYDVDVICEATSIDKNKISPESLKSAFRDALNQSRYSKRYKEWDKCFTVEFEAKDEVDFSIDIIPSVKEDDKTINELVSQTQNPDLVGYSIAIPSAVENSTTWITNNPKGYVRWFERQTAFFEEAWHNETRNSQILNSIEKLPDDDAQNSLLNVIKLLKRTRDVFYYRRKSDNKPSSIIIITVVGELAKSLRPTVSEVDLLKQVIEQLEQIQTYSNKENSEFMVTRRFSIPSIISRKNNKWMLANPANGGDNLLNSWNEDNNKAKEFFAWVRDLQAILASFDETKEEKKVTELYDSFALSLPGLNTSKQQFSLSDNSTKPWGSK
ncbi:nucleotidyltransferase [Leuconostoc fallax]|uniref:nucleotidyltransferase domain-containing protein n=1 Tax=Leuconostoc fallax TaxID=1251 RepID=UPI002090ED21|nr:nucleotidyltransferase [Leuconostoc fallax]MCO6183796.1 nucleotidyltransferase [Leuconostoc fallax]